MEDQYLMRRQWHEQSRFLPKLRNISLRPNEKIPSRSNGTTKTAACAAIQLANGSVGRAIPRTTAPSSTAIDHQRSRWNKNKATVAPKASNATWESGKSVQIGSMPSHATCVPNKNSSQFAQFWNHPIVDAPSRCVSWR